MGSAFAKIGAAVAAAFTVQAVVNFGKVCLEAASNVEEMENKFNVVFQGMTEEVDSWAANYAAAIGRNKNTIKGFLADNQNLFVGMGMTRQAGADLSEQMVELALDLASFNNLEEAQAVNALSKAIMGESEAAKILGAVLNDNTIAMAMNELGIAGRFDALSESEKMEVRYQAILMQSTDAVGDCARSVDSFKGSQIRLQSATENLKETIGAKLLPVASKFVSKFADGASFITSNIDDIMFVVGELASLLIGVLAGKAILAVVSSFQLAKVHLALYTMEVGKAAVANGALSGTLSASQILVGVFTGQISLATAAQSAWNAALSANPIGIVVAALAGLGFIIKKTYDAQKNWIKATAGSAETLEEAAANVDKLKARIAELEATDPAYWSEMNQTELDNLKLALVEAENQFAEFQAAEAAAAESAADPVTVFQEATDEYVAKASELMNKFQETYNSILGSVQGWFKPFEQVAINVNTSIDQMISGMQSQIDFNNQYAENLQYLKEQGLGGLADAFQEYGAEGSGYASAVASALRDAGGAATEEGQKIIESLTEVYGTLEQSQGELANTLTLANGEIETAAQDLVDNYAEKIKNLDMSKEALTNAQNTMSSFLKGIQNGTPQIISAMSSLGQQMTSALQASLGTVTINVQGQFTGVGRYATGLDYVPYDDFPAYLHKGEAVLTAKEAAAWRAGKETASAPSASSDSVSSSGRGLTINQYIQAIAQTPVELAAATEAYFQNARWAMA